MDILYIAGGNDPMCERMLRYSLRSIDMFGKNVGKVYVSAEERPSFLSDEAFFIPTPRRYPRKAKDIMAAIEFSIYSSSIDDDFLYSSDDHFYIRPVDFDDYPFYMRGELPTECKDSDDHYLQHLVDTRRFLHECGLGVTDFSGHVNTHFNRDVFRKYIGAVHKSYDETPYGIEPTCFMVNAIDKERGVHGVMREDIKIACANTYDNIREIIKDAECFSVLSMTMNEAVGSFLQMTYPNKSRYEK